VVLKLLVFIQRRSNGRCSATFDVMLHVAILCIHTGLTMTQINAASEALFFSVFVG